MSEAVSQAAHDVVTVGLDGSPESRSAVLWAAHEAGLRQARLRLLHAWVMLAPEDPHRPDEQDQNYWPHRIMDQARETVRARHPDLPVDEALVAQDPLDALTDAAGESDLLVLGTRELGTMAGYVVGELALQIVTRSGVPTVLVRDQHAPLPVEKDRDVVVGLGLKDPCEALLEFAFETAARRGDPLRAVHGRHLPAHAYNRGGGVEPYVAEISAKDARQELMEALQPWRERFPWVTVDERVVLESPAHGLLTGAEGGGLLAVGRRHRLHVLAPRIGHVVQAAVHHAPCPVAVVPHE
ncbi:universal stress protein [Streptomyces halobius]|uniref:Universal stress protein n=1 Tax=Streptomyces halobius TaxID=2879846 RepID=A0ABY4MHJ7_9ACTN|nr:universal stress protein [Streptomyces halobius]UQA97008.1 universal stress protein [Streptomyces halobius]